MGANTRVSESADSPAGFGGIADAACGHLRVVRRVFAPPVLLSLAVTLLIATWIWACPPGSSADEPAHYVRAVGAGQMDFVGSPEAYTGSATLTPERRAWWNTVTRSFDVPSDLRVPSQWGCDAFTPEVSAACLGDPDTSQPTTREQSYVGTYEPLPYVAPGMLMRAAGNSTQALYLGRLGIALVTWPLLVLAVALVWSRTESAVSLLGVALAETPTVFYLGSSLSDSGPEVAAGLCFAAALVRMARQPLEAWALVGLTVSGSVLATSRPLGPVWVLLDVAVLMAFVGRRRVTAAWTRNCRTAVGAAVLLTLACVSTVVWEITIDPHPHLSMGGIEAYVWSSFGEIRPLLAQDVAVFGVLDTEVSGWIVDTWEALVLVLLATAFVVGTRRQRWFLVGAVYGVVLATVVVDVLQRQTGFFMQGRYTLALVLVVPLWAAEIVRSQMGRTAGRSLRAAAGCAIVVVGFLHVAAWYENAERYAVGAGNSFTFPLHSAWSPWGGWWPSLTLAVVVAAAFVSAGRSFGALSSRPPVAERSPMEIEP